jgi:uridylate kinase
MKSIVLSIGGSVILSEDKNYLMKFKELLKKINENYKLYVIVGGGKVARSYINMARELDFDEKVLDLIGIDITRVNAKILTNLFDESNKEIPITTDEAKNLKNSIVFMGGTTPGHSTDMVGAELANKVGAELFVIATNVDGIYDKDPNKFKDAKQIKQIKIDDVIDLFGTVWDSAGKNTAIDGPALNIIKKSKILTYVVNGKKLDQLEKSLKKKKFDGTEIIF